MKDSRLLTSSRLSQELQDALQADSKRQAIDAAKKRAVGQHVDYETFKNMVAVAHLRPLQDASSVVKVTAAPAWHFSANGTLIKAHEEEGIQTQGSASSQPSAAPQTADALLRLWRKQCPTQEAKWQMLASCDAAKLHTWVGSSLPADMISDMLVVCNFALLMANTEPQHTNTRSKSHSESTAPALPSQSIQSGNRAYATVYNVLHGLAGSKRFGLTVKMLNKPAKRGLPMVFDRLQQELNNPLGKAEYTLEELLQLRLLYQT